MTQRSTGGPTGGSLEAIGFDAAIDARPTDEYGRSEVELSTGWSSLVGIHGGYLAAIAVRGAEARVPGRRVRTITTSYLRRATPGAATLIVEIVRHGRSITTATVTIEQDDVVVTSSRITMVGDVDGVEWARASPIELPPPSACVRVDPHQPVAHFDRVDGLLDPSSLPFTGGRDAMVQGYVRPLERRPIDAAWLAMATDWFPPPAFVRVEPPRGGISVDLTTHVHHTVDDHHGAWLTGRFEIESAAGGLAVERGRIGTIGGLVLAESFHTRWMAGSS